VIADACHSAGTADGDAVGGGGSNAISGGFTQLFTPSRRLMLTAADTNEFAQEDERWGGNGVFTHFLLEGLKGAADADNDGIVTFTRTSRARSCRASKECARSRRGSFSVFLVDDHQLLDSGQQFGGT